MAISALAVCCRHALNAWVGSDQGCDDPCQPIAMGRTGVAQRRSNDTMAIPSVGRASLAIASRGLAEESLGILPRADLDHDVSILIAAVDDAGR
jgi:hypothetical protein